MINTHLKFEAKIPKWLKSCCIRKELNNIFKFKGHFELEGQGHQFSNMSEIFR